MKVSTRRIRNRRHSSFLTHGSDDYDHKGLKRAHREYGKAIVRSFLLADEADEEPAPAAATDTTFRVVVNSQVYENYGTHCCDCKDDESCTCAPYWKAKGGSEYHRTVGTAADVMAMGSKGVEEIANAIRATFERNDRFWHEYAIGWELVPSTQETYEEQMLREMHEEGWPGHETEEQHAACLARLQC
jgi:hypothetical protein